MNNMKNRRKPIHLVLDIIIGVLCVLVVGAGAFAVNMFHETYGYSFDVDSFYYRLSDEDYSQMVEMYYANEAAGVKSDAELEQYYGVAKYFEAASYYKMYQSADDKEQLQKYVEQMQEAQKEMGELEFVRERICEKLEIE